MATGYAVCGILRNMAIGFVTHDTFLEHKTAPDHPERPERLRAILDALWASDRIERMTRLDFGPASVDHIAELHDRDYIERIAEACETGEYYMDSMDTPISRQSYDAALLAVGGVQAACDAVMGGDVPRAFCAVRPPGHHAEHATAMGFCLFNNVALAAEHLLHRHGLSRVAIVDFDVHHCNGTQHAFYERPDVLVASCHEHPRFQFPGTGYEHETGSGDGCGTTVNTPLLPATGDEEAHQAFDNLILPAIDTFKPELILISAGFDAHKLDPLGGLNWSYECFRGMTERLCDAANRHCPGPSGQGRVVSVLEGGYNLDALAQCVCEHVDVLAANMS